MKAWIGIRALRFQDELGGGSQENFKGTELRLNMEKFFYLHFKAPSQ